MKALVQFNSIILFHVSFRKADTAIYHFFTLASRYFKGEFTTQQVIDDINIWTYGINGKYGYVNLETFDKYINEAFTMEGSKGFRDWKALKYFLYEYEISLNKDFRTEFSDLEIEYILPEFFYNEKDKEITIKNEEEKNKTIQKNEKRPKLLDIEFENIKSSNISEFKYRNSNSLGNFILVERDKKDKNKLNEMNFEERKTNFYSKGLKNEQELLNFKVWSSETILERGLKLLAFLESHWNVTFDKYYVDKKKLLNLNVKNNKNSTF